MAKRAKPANKDTKKGYARAEWFLIGAFCVMGLAGLFAGGASVWHGWQSRAWPVVSGKTVRSEVKEVASTVGGPGTAHRPDVEYSYWVDDKEYRGTRIFFGSPERFSDAHAHRIIQDYPEAREVSVAYDPTDPSNAVLEPGLVWEGASFTISITVGGALLFAVGLVAVANGLRKAFGKKAEQPGQMD